MAKVSRTCRVKNIYPHETHKEHTPPIISEEQKNLRDETVLQAAIRRQLRLVLEDKPKVGSETSSAEGTLDVKKMADTLGMDSGKLKTAVTNLRGGKRNSNDNGVFGDLFAKLIDASPEDTVKVMNVLKKVESEPEGTEKK